MQLWDDELEAYREEARNMLQYLPNISPKETPSDPIERAIASRETIRQLMPATKLPPGSCPPRRHPLRLLRRRRDPNGISRSRSLH